MNKITEGDKKKKKDISITRMLLATSLQCLNYVTFEASSRNLASTRRLLVSLCEVKNRKNTTQGPSVCEASLVKTVPDHR